jgi:hypothetical protein
MFTGHLKKKIQQSKLQNNLQLVTTKNVPKKINTDIWDLDNTDSWLIPDAVMN